LFGQNGNALEVENQQILEIGCGFFFSAYASDRATGIFGGFLTLKTEHGVASLGYVLRLNRCLYQPVIWIFWPAGLYFGDKVIQMSI
jgi:hypothetical protein